MEYLGYLAYIVLLVCWIMTLVKMFTDKEKGGVLHGVIGIICGIWAFIWGWMNAGRLNHTKVMLIWSIAWALSFVCYFMFAAAAIQQTK